MESCKELTSCIESKDWDKLVAILKPKDFCGDIPRYGNNVFFLLYLIVKTNMNHFFRTLPDFISLLKVAELLVDEEYNLSEKIKCILLKCLANSCVNGYLEKAYAPSDDADASAHKNIYKFISLEVPKWTEEGPFPYHINFPYEGVVRWVIKTVTEYAGDKRRLTEDQMEVLRLSLQFLCNFFTFAFEISTSTSADVIMEYIKDQDFKNTIM